MNVRRYINDNSPAILSGLGVLGFITAIGMAIKATPKAMEILDEKAEKENSTRYDQAIAVAPVYSPTVGMVLISTACIVAGNYVHNYRYGAMLALYSVTERTLQKWQSSVMDEVSKKKYEQVRDRVLAPEEPAPASLFVEDEEKTICFDVYTGRYFKVDTVESVRRIVNDLNEILRMEDFVPLNDFYFELGIPKVQFGDYVGWHVDNGSIEVDLDAILQNDKPIVTVSFQVQPRGI